jgi:hypothetical protein
MLDGGTAFDNIEKTKGDRKGRPYGGVGGFDFDFNILTALKGWVGHAPQGRGALHIIIIYDETFRFICYFCRRTWG